MEYFLDIILEKAKEKGLIDMDELREELRKNKYRVESYADFVSVGIGEGMKVNLLADGGSELELGFESHRDLSADETKALADVLRIFEEWRQE